MNVTNLKPMRFRPSVRRARPAMALLLLSFATLLAGCAFGKQDAPRCTVAAPENLMQCRKPKTYPDPATATQADIATAWMDADLSAEDCENKLSRLRELALTSKCQLVTVPQKGKN